MLYFVIRMLQNWKIILLCDSYIENLQNKIPYLAKLQDNFAVHFLSCKTARKFCRTFFILQKYKKILLCIFYLAKIKLESAEQCNMADKSHRIHPYIVAYTVLPYHLVVPYFWNHSCTFSIALVWYQCSIDLT